MPLPSAPRLRCFVKLAPSAAFSSLLLYSMADSRATCRSAHNKAASCPPGCCKLDKAPGSLALCVKSESSQLEHELPLGKCPGSSDFGPACSRVCFTPFLVLRVLQRAEPASEISGSVMAQDYPHSFRAGFWEWEGEATGAHINRHSLFPAPSGAPALALA